MLKETGPDVSASRQDEAAHAAGNGQQRKLKRVLLSLFLLGLCLLPLVLNNYYQFVLNTMLVYVLVQ